MQENVSPGEQLVPALYVRDLKSSSVFYQRLGFELVRQDGIFMELKWQQSPLFLVELIEPSTPPPPTIGNLRIMVPDVDERWKLVMEMGLEIIQPVSDRPYGLREFTVAGPDGLHIRFASRLCDQ